MKDRTNNIVEKKSESMLISKKTDTTFMKNTNR